MNKHRDTNTRIKNRAMNKRIIQLLLTISLVLPLLNINAQTTTDKDLRMKWWREARFGMFIHWGLYSIPAGEWLIQILLLILMPISIL